MKTTIEIRDDLLKAAKKRAFDEGVTLRALVEAALEREVEAARDSMASTPRGRELNERLDAARVRFEALVAAERKPGESIAATRLRLLPLPTIPGGDADLSLQVTDVVAEALRRRES